MKSETEVSGTVSFSQTETVQCLFVGGDILLRMEVFAHTYSAHSGHPASSVDHVFAVILARFVAVFTRRTAMVLGCILDRCSSYMYIRPRESMQVVIFC